MARPTEASRTKIWHKRLAAAEKVYDEWDRKYKCKDLEQWYLGHQWKDTAEPEREKYVINLIFPSMETKKPSLLFFRPQAVITPRPGRADDKGTPIEARARLREDTLNTFLQDRRLRFREETIRALHEAFFRFGVIEVGYNADFIDNPRKGKPVLKEDDSEMVGEDGKPVMEPEQVIEDESLFVRRIPACRFRVGANAHNNLEWNDWIAYWEYQQLEDVKRNPNYRNTDKLKPSGKLKQDYEESDDPKEQDRKGMVRLWKIFDQRTKTRYVLADGHEKFLQEKPYKYLPFAVLRFHEILDEFYPLPPVFNWLPAQREYNETREDMRVFRKSAYPRFLYADGKIDEPELLKLERGGPFTLAKANGQVEGVITEVATTRLNQGVVASIPATKEDFNNITSVSSEQRNSAEAETATQAQIKEMRSNIRESFGRFQVAEWVSEIFTLMLKTLEENMALPFWIFTSVDPEGPMLMEEIAKTAQEWQLIKAEQLGALEYDVTVDVESLSPASQETKKREFMDVLANVFGSPSASMVLMLSPALLKRLLDNIGIRSDAVLAEVREALAGMQLMMQAQQQAKAGPPGPGGQAAPGPIPDQPQIQQGLAQQMGGPMQ